MKKIFPKYSKPCVPLNVVVQVVCYLYMLLFVYAAISKLLDFENFRVQLGQSPLLSAYAGIISIAVIFVELFIVLLLAFKATRFAGLYASFFLMASFTVYIYLIINYSDFVPCSCGGIIENLSWTQHLIFNVGFIVLALVAIVLVEKEKGTRGIVVIGKIVLATLVAAGLVTGMFLSSEHIIKKENNFIRRFGQHPVRDAKAFDLGVNSYYFAGIANGQIYLGNVTAPLVLTTVDTALTITKAVKIVLDQAGHPFRSIQFSVKPPYFYLYDGTVSVIYRGHLGDSLARTISFEDAYFSQLAVVDSTKFAIRAQSSKTMENVLGMLTLDQNPKLMLHYDILEKQVDGIFDTDGQLLRDDKTRDLAYVYLYRNEFMVMDSSLHLLKRLHTIDTISRAQVQVQRLSDGSHKMAAPPLKVNMKPAVHGQVMFIESNLMGKFEPRDMWRQASIIDMYRTGEQEYLGSFYVHNRGNNKMDRMFATDKYLFVLSGNEMVRYRFAQTVTRHFK